MLIQVKPWLGLDELRTWPNISACRTRKTGRERQAAFQGSSYAIIYLLTKWSMISSQGTSQNSLEAYALCQQSSNYSHWARSSVPWLPFQVRPPPDLCRASCQAATSSEKSGRIGKGSPLPCHTWNSHPGAWHHSLLSPSRECTCAWTTAS